MPDCTQLAVSAFREATADLAEALAEAVAVRGSRFADILSVTS